MKITWEKKDIDLPLKTKVRVELLAMQILLAIRETEIDVYRREYEIGERGQ